MDALTRRRFLELSAATGAAALAGCRSREILDEIGAPEEVFANGFLFLGTKGALLASPYDPPMLLPGDRFETVVPEVTTPNH